MSAGEEGPGAAELAAALTALARRLGALTTRLAEVEDLALASAELAARSDARLDALEREGGQAQAERLAALEREAEAGARRREEVEAQLAALAYELEAGREREEAGGREPGWPARRW